MDCPKSDDIRCAKIERMKVYCPHCGEIAKLIWSGGNNGIWHASWHCSGSFTHNGYKEHEPWFTSYPDKFSEKPQHFKNLFDF